ncbi:MAG: phosphoribosylformylglycinamidine cyclo-ligase [Candidatus Omnitrophica bacterium]|nr:phosphoribosylformylglycinamidine cyclo-ligase [Candidatus Omnitrophota bacterium]
MKLTYRQAGVNEKRAANLVKYIAKTARETFNKSVITDIGFFGGLYKFSPDGLKQPILVASCDGVGTKILIAREMEKFETVGIDLVAMNVNDVAVCGAKPLFFLDYLAVGKLDFPREEKLIDGIIKGCKLADCALIGGELAQMNVVYKEKDYDLAGFCVGIVDKEKILRPENVKKGDVLIGLASNGIHSNGFSLIHKIFLSTKRKKSHLFDYNEFLGKSLGEELLRPTYIYSSLITKLNKKELIHAAAHITGGGIPGNFERVLPENLQANIKLNSWHVSRIFKLIQNTGKISDSEMFNVFNMGLGLILVAEEKNKDAIIETVKKNGFQRYVIGNITSGKRCIKFIT